MKIISLSILHKNAFEPKFIDFANNVTILQSYKNSTGKTTLVRALLYSLGFAIPNTELVKFENFVFTAIVEINGTTFTIIRNCASLKINDEEFDLPVEQYKAHAVLFSCENAELLKNLLAVFYFDQEKGWTLLNRGIIIGENRFNIESLMRGLNDTNNYDIVAQISALRGKISKYKMMLDIAEYQTNVNKDIKKSVDYQTYEETLDSEIVELKFEAQKIEKEISSLNEIIADNKHFIKYIEQKRLYVKVPNAEPIPVNSSTLMDYEEIKGCNDARKRMLLISRNEIKTAIAKYEEEHFKQETLVNVKTLAEEFDDKISAIPTINSIHIENVISQLEKQKNQLEEILKSNTKINNSWITKFYLYVEKYAKELDLPLDLRQDFVFTHKLKGFSGAILHKLVYIFKLGYISLMSEKLGYKLPIILDSPSGREVETEVVAQMLAITQRDFSEHQIIIASIHKYEKVFPSANIINMDGTLFNDPHFQFLE